VPAACPGLFKFKSFGLPDRFATVMFCCIIPKNKDLKIAESIIEENRDEFIAEWKKVFGTKK
jgi:hypothetical protein